MKKKPLAALSAFVLVLGESLLFMATANAAPTPTATATPTQTQTATADSNVPQNVVLACITNNTIVVDWDAVTGAVGHDVYKDAVKTNRSGDTASPFAGLAACTEHMVQVRTEKPAGTFSALNAAKTDKTTGCTSPSPTGTAMATPPSTQTSDPVDTRDAYLWPFAKSSPWNISVGSGIQFYPDSDPRNVNLQSAIPYINSNNGYGIAPNRASDTDPLVTVRTPNGNFTHRMPANAKKVSGTDGNLDVTDGDTTYSYWIASQDSSGNWSAHSGRSTSIKGTGMGTSPGHYAGIRASGFSTMGGLIRAHEISGPDPKIPHALVVGLKACQLKVGYVWPATTQDGDASSSYCGQIPMGSMFAIPQSVNIDAMGLSPAGHALAEALQDYGAYVGDRSNYTYYAEEAVERDHNAAYNAMLNDLRNKLDKHIKVVSNSSATNIAGGGTRVNGPAPDFK